MADQQTSNSLTFLDGQEFYALMQSYRHSPASDQHLVCARFEAVKEFVRLSTTPEPFPAQLAYHCLQYVKHTHVGREPDSETRNVTKQLEAIIAGASQPPSPARTDEDYAIEHGRYLATAAEQFITSVDEFELATQALEEGTDDETEDELSLAVHNASEAQIDHRNGLANAIYEFRKRADRARPTPTKGVSPDADK